MATEAGAVFVCAHGAGGHMGDASMLRLAAAASAAGFEVVRFNFPYRDAGSKRIDPMPVLKEAFAAAAAKAMQGKKPARLVIGGRSMGGRVASMLAAEGFACDGLLLLAYPLHPAGNLEKLRDAHLPNIKVPVLCINGTRDPLCQKELMTKAIDGLGWQMQWLEGKDHSFAVTAEVGGLAARWLAVLQAGPDPKFSERK